MSAFVDAPGDALISADGQYRYLLSRRWNEVGPPLRFVMLNPSTADAGNDDPTIRRCIGFAKREGYSGLLVLNLYGFRATKPTDLWRVNDPVGPDNDDLLREHCYDAFRNGQPVVAAWGSNAKPMRVLKVRAMTDGVDWRALGVTKNGHPRHPLYVRGDAPLLPWPAVTS